MQVANPIEENSYGMVRLRLCYWYVVRSSSWYLVGQIVKLEGWPVLHRVPVRELALVLGGDRNGNIILVWTVLITTKWSQLKLIKS